ncbi:LicD family protein [Clostridium perfringens]|nr:LicD family protein [Clostridium perfringens]
MSNLNLIKDVLYKIGLYKFSKKYLLKPYQKICNRKFKYSSNDALYKFTESMNKSKYSYWIEFGTLLGAIREKKILSHDNDIDVAMYIDNWDKNLEGYLGKNGFELVKRARLLSGELIEETYKFDNAHIDIFYVYKNKENFIIYDYQTINNMSPNECIKRYGGLSVFKNVFSKFEIVKFQYSIFNTYIPENYDIHLKEIYGDNYMIPNKNWTSNMVQIRSKTDNFAKVEYFK